MRTRNAVLSLATLLALMVGRELYARDLQQRDSIHLDGDLDHKTIYATRIVLLRREEHVRGHSIATKPLT